MPTVAFLGTWSDGENTQPILKTLDCTDEPDFLEPATQRSKKDSLQESTLCTCEAEHLINLDCGRFYFKLCFDGVRKEQRIGLDPASICFAIMDRPEELTVSAPLIHLTT
jgi:hypothetical protein